MNGRANLTLVKLYRNRVSSWTTEKDLWSQIRKAFVDEAETLIHAMGQTEPPFNPVRGLQQRGVQSFKFIEDLDEEARLIPTKDGFTLWLRKETEAIDLFRDSLSPRLRTTLAHELGHTFLFDVSSRPPKPFVSYFSAGERHSASDEEWWCMDFARAYLIPSSWITTQLRNSNVVSLRLASQLRNRLAVSWDLLFRRLIWDLKVWQNCVVFAIERSGLTVRGLWKSREFRKWTFSDWFELEGKDLISQKAHKNPGREVAMPLTIRDPTGSQLLLYSPVNSKLILGAIGPQVDRTLEVFSPQITN